MKERSEIVWWIPGGTLVYSGTPKTRIEWIRLTWVGYVGYWQLLFITAWLLMKRPEETEQPDAK